MADDRTVTEDSSPATRLLDALGQGDLEAALQEFRPTTIVRTEDHAWSAQGEDQVLAGLEAALDRFPGLVFDSHVRHIGYGKVIEEARVRDVGPVAPTDAAAVLPGAEAATDPAAGPGTAEATPRRGSHALVLDRDFGRSEAPTLNMPMRLTVMHDDRFVHEIVLSFPQVLLRAALGERVDPLELSVSQIQAAFMAPAGSGFRTVQLAAAPPPPVALAAVPAPVPPDPVDPAITAADHDPDEPGLRRRLALLVPVALALLGTVAAGVWWLGRDGGAAQATDRPGGGQAAGQGSGDHAKPQKKPSGDQGSKGADPDPTPSPSEPVATRTAKPTVTLRSDLAFAKGSAALSGAAEQAVAKVARQVRRAGLHGTVSIDGYTDNLGSAASGLTLSQLRARAVADYLRSRLGDYRVRIVAVGHGEADPIASNATEAGRQQNRRVTITLPPK